MTTLPNCPLCDIPPSYSLREDDNGLRLREVELYCMRCGIATGPWPAKQDACQSWENIVKVETVRLTVATEIKSAGPCYYRPGTEQYDAAMHWLAQGKVQTENGFFTWKEETK